MTKITFRFVTAFVLLILSCVSSNAQIENKLGLRFYGSFLYTDKVPNALFFFSDIEKNDSFELRKALRNHDIEILVLSSKGGSVWEGLNMAGIIYDKELITYVPEQGLAGEGNCASACSFMFFGGSTRISDGKLGVHQFHSGSASESAKIGTTQKVAQFTVSEIIGFLNEFKTPPFVFERMFQQSEMYYFNNKELGQIARTAEPLKLEDRSRISSFINDFSIELASLKNVDEKEIETTEKIEPNVLPTPSKPKVENPSTDKEQIILIQKRLAEIGCKPGPADGILGRRTKEAARIFALEAGLRFNPQQIINDEFIKKLLKAPIGFCPSTIVATNKAPKDNSERWSGWNYCYMVTGKETANIFVNYKGKKAIVKFGENPYLPSFPAPVFTLDLPDEGTGLYNIKIDSLSYKFEFNKEKGLMSGKVTETNVLTRAAIAMFLISGYCDFEFSKY